MSLFSALIDLLVLLVVVSLVAIGARLRNSLGVKLNLILLFIVRALALFALSLLKVIVVLFGGVVLLAIAVGLLLVRSVKP